MTAPAYPAPAAQNPGRIAGIVGLILAILPTLQFFGLIVSIVGLVMSKRAGQSNGFAVAGIIISIVLTLAGILVLVFAGTFFYQFFGGIIETCQRLGEGVHEVDGVTYTCS